MSILDKNWNVITTKEFMVRDKTEPVVVYVPCASCGLEHRIACVSDEPIMTIEVSSRKEKIVRTEEELK